MTGRDMSRPPSRREDDIDRVIGDWLDEIIAPLPLRIKVEVVAQAVVVAQRGRWPWQRRHARLRLDTLSLGFAPIVVVAVALAMAAMGLSLLVLRPSDGTVLLPAASPAPIESPLETPVDSTAGFAFEEVEPGVVRLIEDGAGHDMSSLSGFDRPPFRLTTTPDGTVWLSQWGGDGTIVGLGRPGVLQHPIGPGSFMVQSDQQGRLWVANNGVASWDGTDWTRHEEAPDQGEPRLIAAHPAGGVVAGVSAADATSFWRYGVTDSERAEPFAVPLPLSGWPSLPMDLTVTADGSAWLIEPRIMETFGVVPENMDHAEYRRVPSRLLRSDGDTWEEVRPLADGVAAEPSHMVLDSAGRLVVHFLESVTSDSAYAEPSSDEIYGDQEWIVRLTDSGDWAVIPSHDGTQRRPGESLLAAGVDSIWIERWCSDLGGGVVEIRADGTRTEYVAGTCVHGAVITPDGRVWVVGTRSEGDEQPVVYVITPQAGDASGIEPNPTEAQG